MACENHNLQVNRIDNLEHKLEADIEDLTEKIEEHETSINNLRKIILGNGVEGMTVRIRTIEKDVEALLKGFTKIEGTMTRISQVAWLIITSIGLTALYWAASILTKHG